MLLLLKTCSNTFVQFCTCQLDWTCCAALEKRVTDTSSDDGTGRTTCALETKMPIPQLCSLHWPQEASTIAVHMVHWATKDWVCNKPRNNMSLQELVSLPNPQRLQALWTIQLEPKVFCLARSFRRKNPGQPPKKTFLRLLTSSEHPSVPSPA